MKQLTIV